MKFYVVAMLFIIFDIETIFLFPWAVAFRDLGLFGLGEMAVFIGLVFVAYVYVWRKGGLDWSVVTPSRRPPASASSAVPARAGGRRVPVERIEGVHLGTHAGGDRGGGRARHPAHHAGPRGRVGAQAVDVAGHVRPGVLRDRDDVDRRRPVRPLAVGDGAVPRARPGRPT